METLGTAVDSSAWNFQHNVARPTLRSYSTQGVFHRYRNSWLNRIGKKSLSIKIWFCFCSFHYERNINKVFHFVLTTVQFVLLKNISIQIKRIILPMIIDRILDLIQSKNSFSSAHENWWNTSICSTPHVMCMFMFSLCSQCIILFLQPWILLNCLENLKWTTRENNMVSCEQMIL